jgi:two-component system chemotaxis response regulator CheY
MKAKTALIVDDSSTIRKIVRGMLEGFGFSCEEAENGQVAYHYCAKTRPDMIMLDWNMPVMSGIEFIRALPDIFTRNMPKVIFCTTESNMSFIEQALNAGAADYVIKPFEKDILRAKLIQLNLIDDAGI